MEERFVATPWRDAEELLRVRRDLFSRGEDAEGDRRGRAVNQILTWRLRRPELPLLLESTADIVDAILQDEQNRLPHNALRLLYATAISRLVTGVSDSQTELSRSRPSWFPFGKTLQFPVFLLETRHRIVHRHLPSLAELKRAAKEGLDWLWEWYWSHLDTAFANGGTQEQGSLGSSEIKGRLQGILKTYVKERKSEIKSKRKEMKAAENAASSYLLLVAPRSTTEEVLAELLVDENTILPADRRLGTSMSGAFLIWTPFLSTLSRSVPSFLETLLDRMVAVISSTSTGFIRAQLDPVREGMFDWLVHILTSVEWRDVRKRWKQSASTIRNGERRLRDHVLGLCFTSPTFWTRKLAEIVLKDNLPGDEGWLVILDAVRSEDIVEVDEGISAVTQPPEPGVEEQGVQATQAISPASERASTQKIRGPQKKVGLWKPQAIGMIPKGWEDDE